MKISSISCALVANVSMPMPKISCTNEATDWNNRNLALKNIVHLFVTLYKIHNFAKKAK